MPFPYKTVLITGATSGIGRALAERMLKEDDIFVIAVGRRQDRLDELAAKHGRDRLATEAHDVADLDGLPAWVKHITTTYPALDCVVLNAGAQNTTDFTAPASLADPASLAATLASETNLNYLSPAQSAAHFLPHLLSQTTDNAKPAALIFVSSCLAVVPMYRCGNYCATKAALHSLAWSLRSQVRHLQRDKIAEGGAPTLLRVVEVLPPAVRTELHSRQPDLVAQGLGDFGMDLDAFTDEAWAGLAAADEDRDEIIVGAERDAYAAIEEGKRDKYEKFEKMIRQQSNKA